jgi:8-oxo-dGTP diphosphatase
MKKLIFNIILAVVAFVLGTVLIPGAFVFAIFKPQRQANFSLMFFELARGIDQTGNAVCFLLFNAALIKDDNLHPFGDVDETVSSVLGRNKQLNNLTWTGRFLDLILDLIDPGHSIKSIGN